MGTSEVVDRKSRFLGEAVRVYSQEEAEAYIAGVRKKHYDARHHCFAWIAGEPGTPSEIRRSGDDGEPSGTAGKPMLEILDGRELHNTLVVVTRYFGGTLLGTGGLVRAYSAAAREAVLDAGTVWIRKGVKVTIRCSYNALGRFQHRFQEEGIQIADTRYSDMVELDAVVPEAGEGELIRLAASLTDGSAVCGKAGAVQYEEPCPE